MSTSELIAPCPHCDEMPELELHNPGDVELSLTCKKCLLCIRDKKKKALKEWNKNYKDTLKFQEEYE